MLRRAKLSDTELIRHIGTHARPLMGSEPPPLAKRAGDRRIKRRRASASRAVRYAGLLRSEDRVAPNLQTTAYPKGPEGRHPYALAAR